MLLPSEQQRTELERSTAFLRERERNLQHLTQSSHCPNRAAAETELNRVRQELVSTYARLRHDQPHGFSGPRYPRG